MKSAFFIFCFVLLSSFNRANGYDSLSQKLSNLRSYVENVSVTYVVGSDTFALPKLQRPPEKLNSFLYYCKERKIATASKYAFLAILKLKVAYGKSDFDFCFYHKNGLVDLALYSMGVEFEYQSVDCAFTTTNDVYRWLLKHPDVYKDYKPLEKYMRKVKKLMQ